MPPPIRSLRCLERFVQVGAPLTDWRREASDGFAAIEPLLMETDRLARRWSQPGRPSMRIVEHDDGRAVAVCDEELGEPMELSHADRVLHRPKELELRARLCQVLGLHASSQPVVRLPGLLAVGEWRAKPPICLGASLAVASTMDHLAQLVIEMATRAVKPTLLLTLTRSMWSVRSDAVVVHGKIALVPLDEVLNEQKGTWARLPAWDHYIAALLPNQTLPADVSAASRAMGDIRERVSRLKQMEREILVALGERGIVGPDARHQPAQDELSKWTGYSCDTSFKTALSTLRKAGMLDNGRHHGRRGGYFLTATGKQAAEFLAKS